MFLSLPGAESKLFFCILADLVAITLDVIPVKTISFAAF
jgi:hypothetical protein